MRGNKVSHSNKKSKRLFHPNLQSKTFFIPEENKEIKLKVSTEGLKTISKNGIYAAVKKAREKGYLNK